MVQRTESKIGRSLPANNLNGRIMLLAAAVLVSVTVTGGAITTLWRAGAAAQQATQHLLEVNEVSSDLRVILGEISAETADVMANPDPALIDDLWAKNASFDETLERLGELIQGEPQQEALFARLAAARVVTRDYGDRFLTALEANDQEQLMILGQDPALFEAADAFGAPFEQLLENAQNTARTAYERNREEVQRAFAIWGAGSVLVILLWGVIAFDWFRQTRRAQRRESQVSALNSELEKRVAERTHDLQDALHRAEAASTAKSQFLASMSHELRTPLNGVLGMTSVLLRGDPREDQRSMLEVVESSGQALLSLVNDILDHARLDAGMMPIKAEPFDLREVLDRSVGIFSVEADRKALEIDIDVRANVAHGYVGDEKRIGQILNNLLSNAVKFTERGSVRVTVAEEEGGVRFAVRDTGCGVPEDRRDGIFDRFSQGDNSTRRRHSGAGLGLALTKQLVDAMDGEMGVTSKVDEGSEFWFVLPLRRAERGAGPGPSPAEDTQAA